jgi:hypothetical protein
VSYVFYKTDYQARRGLSGGQYSLSGGQYSLSGLVTAPPKRARRSPMAGLGDAFADQQAVLRQKAMDKAAAEGVSPAVFRVYDAASRGDKPSPQDVLQFAAPALQAGVGRTAGLTPPQQRVFQDALSGKISASGLAGAGAPLIEAQVGLPPGTLVMFADLIQGHGDAEQAFSAVGAIAAVAGCTAAGIPGPICGPVGGAVGGVVYTVGDQIVKSVKVIFGGSVETCDEACRIAQAHNQEVYAEMGHSRQLLMSSESDMRLVAEFEVARVYNQAMGLGLAEPDLTHVMDSAAPAGSSDNATLKARRSAANAARASFAASVVLRVGGWWDADRAEAGFTGSIDPYVFNGSDAVVNKYPNLSQFVVQTFPKRPDGSRVYCNWAEVYSEGYGDQSIAQCDSQGTAWACMTPDAVRVAMTCHLAHHGKWFSSVLADRTKNWMSIALRRAGIEKYKSGRAQIAAGHSVTLRGGVTLSPPVATTTGPSLDAISSAQRLAQAASAQRLAQAASAQRLAQAAHDVAAVSAKNKKIMLAVGGGVVVVGLAAAFWARHKVAGKTSTA